MPLCPNKLNSCACDDDPLNNTSSEDLDEQVSCAVVNFAGNPGLGQCFGELSSTEVCCSKESIQDAQLCALRRAQENVFGSWTDGSCPPPSDPPLDCAPPCLPPAVPPFGGPAVPIYFNHAQECETVCADGQTFTWSVRAGIITSAISQLDADAKAVSLACQQARRNRLCFADDFLPVGCVGEAYVFQLDAVGGTSPYTWAVITGSLPAGLTMDTTGSISGTPTTGETATFQVELTDDIGSIQVKTFVLSIAAIAPTSLPNGTIGTAYVSQQFTVTPAHDEETEVWSLVGGTLPDGLTLSTAGLLSGTPTGLGASYNLTFQVKFEDTASGKTVTCAKALTLTVNVSHILKGYWNFDAKVGAGPTLRFLDVTGNGNDLLTTHFSTTPAGKIGNCVQPANDEMDTAGDMAIDPTKGFTVCGWWKADPGNIFVGMTLAFDLLNQFELYLDYDGPTPIITVVHSNHSGNFANLVFPSDFDWHFFRAWFDPSDNKLRVQLDNSTIAVTALGFDFGGITGGFLSANSDVNFLDEMGIWQGILTDSEATDLWNSGNGNTYPDVPA